MKLEKLKLCKRCIKKLMPLRGRHVYFDKHGEGGPWERTTRKDKRILRLHKDRWSAPQIARKVGVKPNRVYHVLSKYRKKKS
jgi:hypothetical protein